MARWMAATFLVSALLMAGCASAPQSQGPSNAVASIDGSGAGPAGQASPSTTPAVTVMLEGVILARAPGTGPIPGEGDEASFCFDLPTNSTLLDATLTWDAPEQMGLEFHHGRDRWVSWDSIAQNTTPPIHMAFEDPPAGRWFAYAGPGAVGAAIAWSLNLTVTGSPGSEPWNALIDPEGSRFDLSSDGCFR